MKYGPIICDCYMPVMDGCSLVQLLRSRGCDAQLILYSAKGPDDNIKNALASSMDVHVQ
ncbi:MAG TPA: response regulator [Methanoregula sp.]|nr:response regulator [Methanoregula sp.]